MKRTVILAILAVAALFAGCSKQQFRSPVEFGVNDTRINIPWAQAQEDLEFTIPVYSTGKWTSEIVAGGEWLTIDRNSGNGTEYIHCMALANLSGVPRAVKVEISNGKKTIPIYVVTSSAELAAVDLADADLDNYLL